jgi:GNAT superfamily N-acetyltransferase
MPMQLKQVAQLEEDRLRRGMSEVATEFIELGGGVATRGEKATWINSATGLGMRGPVTSADIDRLIAFHEEWGAEPRIEICPFADPSLRTCLAGRGFNVVFFENVLFRELRDSDSFAPAVPPAQGLEIRAVDPADPVRVREFAMTGCAGFAPQPGAAPREEALSLAAKCATHPRTIGYTAHLEGRCVSAGAIEVSGDIAALFGLSVLHEFRRRGVQSAMIAHRLEVAQKRGAKVATIGSAPGIDTERNVRRAGFQVAYTRVFMSRPGPGLAPARF